MTRTAAAAAASTGLSPPTQKARMQFACKVEGGTYKTRNTDAGTQKRPPPKKEKESTLCERYDTPVPGKLTTDLVDLLLVRLGGRDRL